MSDLKDVLSDHSDFEQIGREAYMAAWNGEQPLLDLVREQDSCRVFVDAIGGGVFVMDVESPSGPEGHYRISPSNDIVDSLEALEQIGFEHFIPEPPQPDEDPFQQVFDAIEQAGRSDQR